MRIEFKVRKQNPPRVKNTWVYPDGNRLLPGYCDEWELDWKELFEEAFVSYKTFKKEQPLLALSKRFPRDYWDVVHLLDWWQKADEEKRKGFVSVNNAYILDVDDAIEYATYDITWLGVRSNDHAGLGAWLAKRYRLWECVDNPEEIKKRFDFAKFARINEPYDVRVCNLFNEFYVLSEEVAKSLYKGDGVFNKRGAHNLLK